MITAATTKRLACVSAIALTLGACQSLKGAKAPEATAQAQGPVTTLQQAIGGKPALIPVGAPVVAQAPTPEPTASAYAPTSAPAAPTEARSQVTAPAAQAAQVPARAPSQVVPATQVSESVPTAPVQSTGGPVKTLVDALRGNAAPRAALVPQSPAANQQASAPQGLDQQPPAQAPAPAGIERPPYDGRVSVQGPQMHTITINPAMPDPRVRDALRAQGADFGAAGTRPPNDSDIKNLF